MLKEQNPNLRQIFFSCKLAYTICFTALSLTMKTVQNIEMVYKKYDNMNN